MWRKGQSGNPSGRPAGRIETKPRSPNGRRSKTKKPPETIRDPNDPNHVAARKFLTEKCDLLEVWGAVYNTAREGNMGAIRFIADIVGVTHDAIIVEGWEKAVTIKEKSLLVLDHMASGKIGLKYGEQMLSAIAKFSDISKYAEVMEVLNELKRRDPKVAKIVENTWPKAA